MKEAPYGPDLALIHHLGFSGYSDLCAPGVVEQLDAVLEKGSTVLELGCGSGGLTRHLIDAGYTVIATDASPDMLDIAREQVPEADVRRLTLPDDSLPSADAVVSVGHTLNFLESADGRGGVGQRSFRGDRVRRDGSVFLWRRTPPGGDESAGCEALLLRQFRPEEQSWRQPPIAPTRREPRSDDVPRPGHRRSAATGPWNKTVPTENPR